MKIEQLVWMNHTLKELQVVTQQMISEARATGGTPEPDAHDNPPVEPEEIVMSYQDLQAAALTLRHAGGRELVEQFVKNLGVKNLKDLPKEQYADAIILSHEMRQKAVHG